jgi:hypothetical protein
VSCPGESDQKNNGGWRILTTKIYSTLIVTKFKTTLFTVSNLLRTNKNVASICSLK